MTRSVRRQRPARAPEGTVMRMPGFTAEAGLERTLVTWRTGIMAAGGRGIRIEPQFCFANSGGDYYTCCYCAYGYCSCTVHRAYRLV